MFINEWALLGILLNAPLFAYLLLRWSLLKRVRYVDPRSPSSPVVQIKETKSPPVSGAGPPDAGTGGETG